MSEKDDGEKQLVGCVVALFTSPLSIALHGWAVQILWGWFLTPLIDMPAPGIATCYGLALFAAMFIPSSAKDRDWPEMIALSVIKPLGLLGIGYVVHLFA